MGRTGRQWAGRPSRPTTSRPCDSFPRARRTRRPRPAPPTASAGDHPSGAACELDQRPSAPRQERRERPRPHPCPTRAPGDHLGVPAREARSRGQRPRATGRAEAPGLTGVREADRLTRTRRREAARSPWSRAFGRSLGRSIPRTGGGSLDSRRGDVIAAVLPVPRVVVRPSGGRSRKREANRGKGGVSGGCW